MYRYSCFFSHGSVRRLISTNQSIPLSCIAYQWHLNRLDPFDAPTQMVFDNHYEVLDPVPYKTKKGLAVKNGNKRIKSAFERVK